MSPRNDIAAVRVLRRDDAIQFAHDADAHLPGLPVLALAQVPLAVLIQDQIHAAIRAGTAHLQHRKTLPPKGFAHELFEVLPRHGRKRGFGVVARPRHDMFRAPASYDGHQHPDQEAKRDRELEEKRGEVH